MRKAVTALAAAMLLADAAQAAPSEPLPDPELTLLQHRDGQLFALGWRLATANAAHCAAATPALGLQLLDAGAFKRPGPVRAQLGLTGDIAVGAVAPDSPAARAGLAQNDTILAIGDIDLANGFPAAEPRWKRLIAVTAALDSAVAQGPVRLRVARGQGAERTVIASGVPTCPTRFEVLSSGKAAFSEGTRVVLGRDFPLFSGPDDMLAVVIAHELAHNLLRHNAALDSMGRSLGNQRITEREADRLSPWLLANAGFDPESAARFFETWFRKHDGGLFRARDHEAWDERAAAVRAELPLVRAAMESADGRADWAQGFSREALNPRR